VIPRDLLDQAAHLAKRSPKKPRRTDLSRAVSAAYYAVFHALCYSNANVLAGTGVDRPSKAWLQAYRAVEHGQAKKRCKSVADKGFPVQIQDFADAFVALQELRHRADYDPEFALNRSEAMNCIEIARRAVAAIKEAPVTDRRAFALHVLLPYRD
jgi:hypothetical protein